MAEAFTKNYYTELPIHTDVLHNSLVFSVSVNCLDNSPIYPTLIGLNPTKWEMSMPEPRA